MYRAPAPPQPTSGGNPNSNSSGSGGGGPSSLSPPAVPSGEAVAERGPSSPPRSAQAGGGGGGGSVYDLFLTAVGLTPRGLGAEAFSPDGSAGQAEEEEFWSAHEESREDGAGAGTAGAGEALHGSSFAAPALARPRTSAGTASATAAPESRAGGGEEGRPFEPRQLPAAIATDGGVVNRASGATPAAVAAAAATQAGRGAHSRPGDRPTSRTRRRLLSDAYVGPRHPGGELDGRTRSTSLSAAAVVAGTARRRRLFRNNTTASASESESRTPGSRTPSAAAAAAPRRLNSIRRGNPLFRSGDFGSFWRPNVVAGNATFDDEGDEDDDDDGDTLGAGGTRAIERAATNSASAPTAAVTDAGADAGAAGRPVFSRRGGSSSLDASERGEGGGDGSGGAGGGQGRILFYHKPTLANVPAGDVPDVVPVYLGCPRGNMALGLPLNEAWQGEEHQDTTFNQNLSYTILSWPEEHVQDLLELWRLQALFFATIVFNILLSGLLFFADNPDRTRVEGFATAGAFPEPFQQRSPADDPTGSRSQEWHLTAALLLSVVGMVCVLARLPAGVALYLVLTVVNAVVGLGQSPDPLFAIRYAVDVVLVVMGRTLLSSMTYTWVTASAGDGRRAA